ncbi:MAG: hypothetical protein QF706_00345, partial [Roseibacillus sp.]|nr:hypothetical protein [Roseibacillus sp.]
MQINRTGLAVDESFTVDGNAVSLELPAGPYTRIASVADDSDSPTAQLVVAGQALTGAFDLQQRSDGSVQVIVADATLSSGSGVQPFVELNGGSGTFYLDDSGLVGALRVETFALRIPGLHFTTNELSVQVNKRPVEVSDEFLLGSYGVERLTLPAGPYFRVVVLGASVGLDDLSVGSAAAQLSGDFFLEQSGEASRLVMSNVAASVDIGGDGARLVNGSGGLVLTETGVAGVISGELDVQLGSLAAGGTLILRINNTGRAVKEILQLGSDVTEVTFSADEGKFFAVSLTGASLNIADIVWVEGSFSFVDSGPRQIAAGSGLLLFVGEGEPTLADGTINPDARGVLINDATVGLVQMEQGDDMFYALNAVGTIEVVGINDLTVTGKISVRINTFTTGINETITIAGSDDQVEVVFDSNGEVAVNDEPFSRLEALGIVMEVAGQRIAGNLALGRFRSDRNNTPGDTSDDESVLRLSLDNATAAFGDGSSDLLSFSGGEGDVLVFSDGIGASLGGNIQVTVPAVTLNGDFAFQVSTTGRAINETFEVFGATRMVEIRAGPYVQVSSVS